MRSPFEDPLSRALNAAELACLLAEGFDAVHPSLPRLLDENAAPVPPATGFIALAPHADSRQRQMSASPHVAVFAAVRVSASTVAPSLSDVVAVKVLDDAEHDPSAKGVAQEECCVLRAAQGHSHVVKLIAEIQCANATLMVHEFLPGGTLEKWVVEKARLRRRESGSSTASSIRGSPLLASGASPTFEDYEMIRIAKQLVWAASFLHARRIYHGNLSLQNAAFMWEPPQDPGLPLPPVKIFDFGCATRTKSSSESLATPCGSPAYACPEMAAGHQYNPQKADVFSLGVALYRLLTGRFPFEDKAGMPPSSHAQVARLVTDSPVFEAAFWSRYPPALESTVKSMLRRSGDDRPTLNHVLSAMEGMLCDLSAALARKSSAGLQKKRTFNGFTVLKKSASTASETTHFSRTSSQDSPCLPSLDKDSSPVDFVDKKTSRKGIVQRVRGGFRHNHKNPLVGART